MTTLGRRHVDADDGLGELLDLWSANSADALHRVLVLHQPVRANADAFEPFCLLQKHHKTDPEHSLTTALLLLTDRRWRNGSARLVRRIAESGILDAEQLDLLAHTFLAADDALYWQIPEEWFAGGEFVIDLDSGTVLDEDAHDSEPVGPTVARREVFPPLRRWAAAHELACDPSVWAALLSRARELDARHGASVAAGVLDCIDVLPATAARCVVTQANSWPDQTVRRLALEFIAAHDGATAAAALAVNDPNARIRAWAANLVAEVPAGDANGEAAAHAHGGAQQPALF